MIDYYKFDYGFMVEGIYTFHHDVKKLPVEKVSRRNLRDFLCLRYVIIGHGGRYIYLPP